MFVKGLGESPHLFSPLVYALPTRVPNLHQPLRRPPVGRDSVLLWEEGTDEPAAPSAQPGTVQ